MVLAGRSWAGIISAFFHQVSGVFFCMFAACILLLQRMRYSNAKHIPAPRPRRVLPALIVFAAGIAGWLIWKLYVSAGAAGSSLSAVLSLRSGLQPYQKKQSSISSTLCSLPKAVLALACSPRAVDRRRAVPRCRCGTILNANPYEGKRSLLDALLLTAGYVVWLLILLIGYLTSFVEGEALSLAAFCGIYRPISLARSWSALSVVQAMVPREPRARRNLLSLLLIGLLLTARYGACSTQALARPIRTRRPPTGGSVTPPPNATTSNSIPRIRRFASWTKTQRARFLVCTVPVRSPSLRRGKSRILAAGRAVL